MALGFCFLCRISNWYFVSSPRTPVHSPAQGSQDPFFHLYAKWKIYGCFCKLILLYEDSIQSTFIVTRDVGRDSVLLISAAYILGLYKSNFKIPVSLNSSAQNTHTHKYTYSYYHCRSKTRSFFDQLKGGRHVVVSCVAFLGAGKRGSQKAEVTFSGFGPTCSTGLSVILRPARYRLARGSRPLLPTLLRVLDLTSPEREYLSPRCSGQPFLSEMTNGSNNTISPLVIAFSVLFQRTRLGQALHHWIHSFLPASSFHSMLRLQIKPD